MKQSTKLLSLVLAIVMAFSCMTVIGNAADTISNSGKVTHDSIDDALLTPEQVADIALDLVDGLLEDADIGKLEVIGMTLLDLTNVNTTLDTLFDLADGALFKFASGIVNLGALEELTFDPLEWENSGNGVQRGNGNLQVLYHLLDFVTCDTNAKVLRKAAYGINGSDSRGIQLGVLGDLLGDLDLSEINNILANLKGFAGDLIYDMLLHGSYRHPLNAEELKEAGQALPYGGSLDNMLNYAILNLLTDPQDYEYNEADEKVWDENSILLPGIKAFREGNNNDENTISYIDIRTKSVFDILNVLAQTAIDDLGVLALNHNLKKGLMEAVDVELVEIDETEVPDDVMAVFENEAAYTTYISYDCMQKGEDGEWYYTTKETQDVVVNGKPVKDEDDNVVTERVSVYYKANTALANEFYDLINWDYKIYKTADNENPEINEDVFTEAEVKEGVALAPNTIDYNYMVTGTEGYGSLVESLNHLVYIVYENALTDETKEDFAYVTGSDGWVDGSTTEKINDNLNTLIKYLLVKFPGMIFGKSSAYALEKENYDDEKAYYDDKYADMSLIDIVALIGPSFFEDVMPQLVMPVDENGAYAFAKTENGKSVALLQFGALVLREFMTEIAPNVNYDEFIFEAGTLTSAEGRQFATHTAEEWFNIILNMGVDVGYTYLYNITNFGDELTFSADGTGFATKNWRATTLPEAPTAATAVSEARWMGMLDEAINWAVTYVGLGSNGVLTGINPDKIATMNGDPFGKLSYILNTILPLGFVNGCESANYDLDVEIVFNKLKSLLTTFDFTELTSLFGRNGVGTDGSVLKRGNILAQPVVPMVLGLLNDILNLVFARENILPVEDTLDNVANQDTVSALLYNILSGLNGVRTSLLLSALPVVGKLIKGWGTEQNFEKPEIDLDSVVDLDNGSGSTTVTFSNGANGIWRSWMEGTERKYDEQYSVKITNVEVKDFEGKNDASGVTLGTYSTAAIAYGKDTSFDLSFSCTSNQFVRVNIYYQVFEGSNQMGGTTYVDSAYTYVVAKETDEGGENLAITNGVNMGTYNIRYIDLAGDVADQVMNADLVFIRRKHSGQLWNIQVSGTSVDGFTPGSVAFKEGMDKPYLGANTERNWDPLEVFINNDYTVDEKTLTVSGASIDTSNFNKKPGQTTEFTFTFHANGGSTSCMDSEDNRDGTAKSTLVYYDLTEQPALINATADEIGMSRVAEDYKTTGYSYADRVLATETEIDPETNEVITLKETNFSDTAWVDQDGEPLADDITVTPNTENEEIGTYYVDGVKYTAKLVTKIDNSKVWATYVNAINVAADAAWSPLTITGNFYYEEASTALNAAATDLSYCTADTKADTSVDDAIDTKDSTEDLKGLLDSVEAATTDKYDYTDYMMWRLNRLNDARDDAAYYINLKKDADRAYANVDKKFPYTSIEKDDLTALVALEANKEEIADKGYSELILALLEDLTKEEAAAKKAWLADRDREYAGVTAFDIALAKSMLEKTSARLRNRDYKGANGEADTTYLATEIASAEAMFTDSSLYTEKSWNRYAAALAEAKAVVNGDSQKDAFDKKWELLCCRNELVLVEEAADYSELEALIEQAKFALSHQTMYENSKKELGQVLAELGIEGEVVTADGYGINLFPGSALYTFAEPYTTEDQDIIDDAADDLKEALARLKFYNVGITAVEGNGNVAYNENATIVFDNPDTKDVDESVVIKLATIDAGMNEDAVKALFDVTATGATVGEENITVSNDRHYSLERYEEDEDGNKVLVSFQGFAGTNSVVTFYTVQDGIKIPVATIRLVVNGDINGDGTVDVIDAAQMHLATNSMATLEGCYLVAGNLAGATDATRVIDGDDYTQVINAVVGPEAA